MNRFTWGILMSCGLAFIGCGLEDQGIAGVRGKVRIDGTAAPEGTILSFSNLANESDAFMVSVDSAGGYEYRPPQGILLALGEYGVVVIPKRRRTEMGPNFIAKDVPIPGAPVAYGKYTNAKTSDLRADFTSGQVETFDIDISTAKK